jgi:hypothetical protein
MAKTGNVLHNGAPTGWRFTETFSSRTRIQRFSVLLSGITLNRIEREDIIVSLRETLRLSPDSGYHNAPLDGDLSLFFLWLPPFPGELRLWVGGVVFSAEVDRGMMLIRIPQSLWEMHELVCKEAAKRVGPLGLSVEPTPSLGWKEARCVSLKPPKGYGTVRDVEMDDLCSGQ